MREGQAKVLSEREFNRVVNAAKKMAHAKSNIALLYCSFGLGLRAKEMAALKVKHVLGVDGIPHEKPRSYVLYWQWWPL